MGDASSELFEPRKAAIYEWLGIVVRSDHGLKLSPLGWDMARQLEPAAHPFRTMIADTETYHSVLNWALRMGLERITFRDVVSFWRRHYAGAFSGKTDPEVNHLTACFFDLCQAAALGEVCHAGDVELASLRLDREELAHFLMPAAEHPRLVAVPVEDTAARRKTDNPPQPQNRAIEHRGAAPGNQVLSEQTVALKILSLALIEELKTLDEGHNLTDSSTLDFFEIVRRFETALIKSALTCAQGRQRRAARLLNMSKSTFNAKLKRYMIESSPEN